MGNRTIKVFIFCLSQFVFCFTTLPAQFYRGSQQEFGKNRVQYNDFLWTFYRFKNFDVYFYLGGQELAAFTGKSADKEIEDIEHLFDYKTSGRLQFMVFNKLSDLKQSNIGLEDLQTENGNIGGITRVLGNKIMIYYDGNHEHFRQQIRAGVSKVLIEQLMYGGNIKDRVQSAVLLNLPAWYTEGLVSYISTGWTASDDNQMRDGILSGKYRKFNRMLDNEEIFAGHSLWNFVVESYGSGVVANLLYMTRINRNIESGFVYVLGSSLTDLSHQWLDYYQKQYLNADKNRMLPSGDPVIAKPKNNRRYSQAKFSPDGMTLAFVTNDIGKYRVLLYDRITKRRKCILKGGYKSLAQKNDLSFPVLAWHPSGQMLSIMREKKGQVYLDNYNVSGKKTVRDKFFYFEKVLDFSYSQNGQQMVLSGVQKGQSDIYVYDVRARTSRQITKDIYDDLNPRFVMGSKFIVFSSNRINDTLVTEKQELAPPSSHFDIFLYEQFGRSQVLKRVTHTPWADEIQPLALDSSRFAFLSDASGIFNRYTASVDSVISFIDTAEHYRYVIKTFPQTNYARNIEEHDLNFKKTAFAEIIYTNGKYKIFAGGSPSSAQTTLQAVPGITPWYEKKSRNAGDSKQPLPVNIIHQLNVDTIVKRAEERIAQPDSGKIDINDYVFQSEFPRKKKKIQEKIEAANKTTQDTATVLVIPPPVAAKADTAAYQLPKQRNYDPAFSSNYFVAQLDNSLSNSTYQTFTGGAVYFDPGLTGLFKVGISDLMNDYKITAGFRLAGDLNSNEYLLSFEDLKKRIDKQYTFYRQAREFTVGGFYFIKVHTHEVKYILKYPFNDLASMRGTVSYRNDRTAVKSTDVFALQIPNFFEHWASAKVEYVFDNTIKRGLNLYNGIRYKIFAEGFRQVDHSKTFMGVVGADFRYYLKVHRQIVWVNRVAASSSFGDVKLVYYLGSQDNAIVPTDNFNYSINLDTSQNYAFQTLATPMRGFIQNIRNGNNFAVVNSELRIPVFQYFIRRPIRSDFIRSLQIITFADVGSAWTGGDPYSKDNSLNIETIPGKPITVVLRKQIEPIVAGYGFGIRSRIFGYYLKADWAWGYEDGKINDSIFYLTLGLDL